MLLKEWTHIGTATKTSDWTSPSTIEMTSMKSEKSTPRKKPLRSSQDENRFFRGISKRQRTSKDYGESRLRTFMREGSCCRTLSSEWRISCKDWTFMFLLNLGQRNISAASGIRRIRSLGYPLRMICRWTPSGRWRLRITRRRNRKVIFKGSRCFIRITVGYTILKHVFHSTLYA